MQIGMEYTPVKEEPVELITMAFILFWGINTRFNFRNQRENVYFQLPHGAWDYISWKFLKIRGQIVYDFQDFYN